MFPKTNTTSYVGWDANASKCEFLIEEGTDQRNAQINFALINLLLFKLLRHVSAT